MNYYRKSIDECLMELNTSKSGLTDTEVENRLKRDGYNILPKKKPVTIFHIFFKQFIEPLTLILIATMFISILTNEIIDAAFIFICIIIDGTMGTIQEWKAENSSKNLQSMIKSKQLVIRDNKKFLIDAEYLVKGDIVCLESGDKLCADIRIIEDNNLSIDESLLTGESINVTKNSNIIENECSIADRKNEAYAGTIVVTGRALGVVTNTGTLTEIGKIANHVLKKDVTKTPLTIRMEKFTKQITYIILVVALIITYILYLKGYAQKDIFFLVVALSISAIPEGLPMVLTISLSIAAKKMSNKNVIVRKLNSVEGLGSCTVIASDKTGTLTINEQTAKIVMLNNGSTFNISGIGYNDEGNYETTNEDDINLLKEIAFLGASNNEATLYKKNTKWQSIGDAIDIAFLSLNRKVNRDEPFDIEIIKKIPYESNNGYSAIFYKKNNKTYVTVKGSIEAIEKLSHKKNDKINSYHDTLANNGYRVIAVAKGIVVNNQITNLEIMGIVGFIDPIRKEAKLAIKKCHKAGIKVVMITGDHYLTAKKIATDLELINESDSVATSDMVSKYYDLGTVEFDNFIKNHTVFSRVTPTQKFNIIESFKRQGEFIAVTGDGVNDAPALKNANIGISMGSGSDVTKDAGELIITDDNFASIVDGIEEGRIAYSNIRKVIWFLLSCGVCEIISYILAIIFNLEVPFLAVQLLWINLVTDGIQDIALAMEEGEKNEMDSKPRSPKESIFDKRLKEEILISGITSGLIIFIFWFILLKNFNIDVKLARTYTMFLMVLIQNLHAFNCRSEHTSLLKLPLKNNRFLIIAILATIVIQIIVTSNSFMANILSLKAISVNTELLLILLAIPIIIIMEIYKLIRK